MILAADNFAAPDPRIARAEKWLCMVMGLRLIAVSFLRVVERLIEPPIGGTTWRGPRIVFPHGFALFDVWERVSRALHLAISLEMKIEKGLDDLRAGKDPSWDAPASEAGGEGTVLSDKSRETGPEALADDVQHPRRPANLRGTPRSPFQCDKTFYRLLKGPLRDAVAAICADLGLKPDWSQWTDDGFPPPPREVENWDIFLYSEPEGEAAPDPSGHIPLTPPSLDEPGAGNPVWRPTWPPRRRSRRGPRDFALLPAAA